MRTIRIKAQVSNPCNEKWEEMLPEEQGRFCLNCQKTVIDFTSKTDAEILAVFANNPNTCGRFTANQLIKTHESRKPLSSNGKSLWRQPP